jgi:acetyl esterase/lipase/type 1 glutamine amidotransferase
MIQRHSFRLGAASAPLATASAAALLCWALIASSGTDASGQASAPKRLLVVSTTLGFRHSSIEVGEKVLRDLALGSGQFTLEFASVNPNDPKYALNEYERAGLKSTRGGGRGFGPGMILAPALVSQADKDGDKAVTKGEFDALAGVWFDKLDADKAGRLGRAPFASRLGELLPMPGGPPRRADAAAAKPKRRRTAPPINLGGFVGPGLFAALDADKDGSLTREEMTGAFEKWATAWDADKNGSLSEAEIREGFNGALPRPPIGGFERNPKADAAVHQVLAEKMSREALKRYDGVVFLNTTGDLPFPDPEAFYKWVEEGHAVIGMHAAADTLHGDSRYARMLGGEFANHGAQVEVNVLNADPEHPATAGLGSKLNLFEEVYLFKNYDRAQVHDLLVMDEHPNTEEPGHYPVTWVKSFGKGRVFYTSLGHREDVWDPEWKDPAGKRENPPEVAEAYQKHLLGGIRWALGLAERERPGRAGAPRDTKAAPAEKAEGSAAAKVIPVWPDRAPGSEGWTHKEVEYRNEWDRKAMVRNVTTPTLTAFLPDSAVATGAAVVVCPGGGFRFLSWQSEGTEVAEWLQQRGVAAFVLRYRVLETPASDEDFRKEMAAFFRGMADRRERPAAGEAEKREAPKDQVRPAIPESMRKAAALGIADGRQAIKVVRQHATEWGIKPDRIGIMGFSAGGMVTMGVAMDHDAESRPDFAAPIYGGGTNGAKVPDDAPPLFILCASDDRLAAAGSARLYSEWKAANRPVELHIYEKGGHGFGMTPRGLPVDRWIERFGDWLGQRGLIKGETNSLATGARSGG